MTTNRFKPQTWTLVAAIALCFVLPTQVAAQEDDTAAYWQLVDESIDILEQTPVPPETVDELIGRWETLAENSEALEPSLVIEQLKSGSSPDDLEAHVQMFQALQTTRDTWPEMREGTLTAEQAQAQLEALLAEDRFNNNERETWLGEQYRQWRIAAEQWLNENVFNRNRSSGENQNDGRNLEAAGDPIIGLIGIVAATVLVLILFQLIQQVTLGFNREGITLDSNDDTYEPLTVEEAMERADKTAERGDYRHSVRYLYLSTLLILEEKRIIKTDRSLTNQEYLNVMRQHPRKASVLRDVVNIFDRVWYGKEEIDQPTLRFYQDQIRELQEDEAEA
ncbi:MAG: DUF4129 domain-containing protein [Chloroflexota bacterium]